MSQIDKESPKEIINELKHIAPTLAKLKVDLNNYEQSWESSLLERNWAAPKKKVIRMNFLKVAAALIPLVIFTMFFLKNKQFVDQNPVTNTELDDDLLFELLAQQAPNFRTEELLDLGFYTNIINTEQ